MFILDFLNQSLWLDEATTAQVARHFGYWDIITKFSPTDFHPPLFYLIIKFWCGIFGYSEIALRAPSMIAWLAIIFLVWKYFGKWAGILTAFNPLLFYYSHEARMYSLATLIAVTTYIAYSKKMWKLFHTSICIGLCMYYGFAYFVGGLIIFDLFIKNNEVISSWFGLAHHDRFCHPELVEGSNTSYYYGTIKSWKEIVQRIFFLSWSSILTVMLLSPLLMKQAFHAHDMLSIVSNWKLVLGTASIKNILLIFIKFVTGRIPFGHNYIFSILLGLSTLIIWIGVAIQIKKQNPISFIVILPIMMGIIVSPFVPMLQYFRFVYVIPFFCISISSMKWIKEIALITFMICAGIYIASPDLYREDWRSLAQSVKTKDVYMIYSSSDPMQYYRPNLRIRDISTLSQTQEKVITIIPYAVPIYGVTYQHTIKTKGYILKSKNVYRGVESEIWERKTS